MPYERRTVVGTGVSAGDRPIGRLQLPTRPSRVTRAGVRLGVAHDKGAAKKFVINPNGLIKV